MFEDIQSDMSSKVGKRLVKGPSLVGRQNVISALLDNATPLRRTREENYFGEDGFKLAVYKGIGLVNTRFC